MEGAIMASVQGLKEACNQVYLLCLWRERAGAHGEAVPAFNVAEGDIRESIP
jgi:hypothetical protein